GDDHRGHPGHAAVHEPRAGQGRTGRPGRRHLQPGPGPVRDPDGEVGLRGVELPGRGPAAGGARGGGRAAARSGSEPTPRPGGDLPEGAGGAPRGPLCLGARPGRGGGAMAGGRVGECLAGAGRDPRPAVDALRKALLKEPMAFFGKLRDQLQSDGDTRPEALAKLAAANFDLASTTRQIGRIPDAVRSYSESITIRERLVRDNPGVAQYL